MAKWGTSIAVFCEKEDTDTDIEDRSFSIKLNKPNVAQRTGGFQQVYYQNVRGLRTKTEGFFTNLLTEEYDIVALTETWLCDSIFSSELFDDRYTVIRRDRSTTATRGGGVLAAFNKKIPYEIIESNCEVECIFVKLKFTSLFM